MKIRTPDNKYNIAPKAFSMFPFFAFMAILSVGINKHSAILLTIAGFFAFIFLYTFFFAKYDRYLDTERKMIISRLHWLWIRLDEEEPIEHFAHICINLGQFIAKSNWSAFAQRPTYEVFLVRKYTYHYTMGAFGNFENFAIKTMIHSPQEAKEYAETISKLINIDVVVGKQLTAFLKYDLLNSKAF